MSQRKIILKDEFSILDSEKHLYVVLWVDDFGAYGELPHENRRWYHENAGPISYALEWDDRGFFDPSALFKKYDFSYDFLSHHLHAMHWSHSRLHLYLDYYLCENYSGIKKFLNDALSKLPIQFHLRDRYAFAILFSIRLIFLLCGRRKYCLKQLGIIAILASLVVVLLALNNRYLSNPRNWTYELKNPRWCKDFLLSTRKNLLEHGFVFPKVLRHGWNLPPAGLMEFYMSELGVLTDASAISGLGSEIVFWVSPVEQ
ncbi:MAG: hypothetical protein ACFFCW_06215 [Candidatus Hodarchaeota archaeon]